MSLLALSGTNSLSGGYEIDNSVKLEADNTEFFSRTPSSNTNRQTFTYSTWVKRTELGGTEALLEAYQDGSNFFLLQFSGSKGRITVYNVDSGIDYGYRYTPAHTDTSAWYHIVLVSDTTNSTAADRYRLYVNGVRVTDITTDYGTPPQNYNNNLNTTITHNIGRRQDGNTYMSAYLAETHLVDGTALAPTAFGEFDEDSGIWKPKAYTGSYGTNGFFLDFADASDLGDDESGNGNDFTENNITAADQATDTPTNNFAILSQSMQAYYQDLWSVISEGGTKFRCTEFDAWITTVSSIGVTKGKWYAEFKITGARPNNMFGIASMEQLDTGSSHLGQSGGNWGIGYYQSNGNLFKVQNSGSSTVTGWGSSISQNQTVGIAVDMDNHNLYIAINNTYQNSGDPTSGATGTGAISFDNTETVAIAITGYSLGSGNDTIVEGNFGGFSATSTGFTNTDANGYGTFAYAPPSGYYALCTKNLAEYG